MYRHLLRNISFVVFINIILLVVMTNYNIINLDSLLSNKSGAFSWNTYSGIYIIYALLIVISYKKIEFYFAFYTESNHIFKMMHIFTLLSFIISFILNCGCILFLMFHQNYDFLSIHMIQFLVFNLISNTIFFLIIYLIFEVINCYFRKSTSYIILIIITFLFRVIGFKIYNPFYLTNVFDFEYSETFLAILIGLYYVVILFFLLRFSLKFKEYYGN